MGQPVTTRGTTRPGDRFPRWLHDAQGHDEDRSLDHAGCLRWDRVHRRLARQEDRPVGSLDGTRRSPRPSADRFLVLALVVGAVLLVGTRSWDLASATATASWLVAGLGLAMMIAAALPRATKRLLRLSDETVDDPRFREHDPAGLSWAAHWMKPGIVLLLAGGTTACSSKRSLDAENQPQSQTGRRRYDSDRDGDNAWRRPTTRDLSVRLTTKAAAPQSRRSHSPTSVPCAAA